MPKLGATPIGYKIAEQFGLKVLPTMAALVPFTLHQHDKDRFEGLSGISVPCIVSSEDGTSFKEKHPIYSPWFIRPRYITNQLILASRASSDYKTCYQSLI